MKRSSYLILGLFCLLGIGLFAFGDPEQLPKAVVRADLNFKSPVLVESQNEVVVTLDAPEIRELAGKHFLVGKECKDSPYTRETFQGGIVWVPLEKVTRLVELPKTAKNR